MFIHLGPVQTLHQKTPSELSIRHTWTVTQRTTTGDENVAKMLKSGIRWTKKLGENNGDFWVNIIPTVGGPLQTNKWMSMGYL